MGGLYNWLTGEPMVLESRISLPWLSCLYFKLGSSKQGGDLFPSLA